MDKKQDTISLNSVNHVGPGGSHGEKIILRPANSPAINEITTPYTMFVATIDTTIYQLFQKG